MCRYNNKKPEISVVVFLVEAVIKNKAKNKTKKRINKIKRQIFNTILQKIKMMPITKANNRQQCTV